MTKKLTRKARRQRVKNRIRNKISGTAERPRLCVFRSLKHTYAQLIDDNSGRTLVSASTLKASAEKTNGANVAAAKWVGEEIAAQAKSLGIEQIVFDRAGYIYHGRVKALATTVREAGLKF